MLETDRFLSASKGVRSEHRQNSPIIVTGKGGRNFGRGGRGYGRSSRGRGRGQNCTGTSAASKKGLCEALGTNVFDCGQKAAADQMPTSWEKLAECVGFAHGQDTSNELQNKAAVILVEPVHEPAMLLRNQARETVSRASQGRIQAARRANQVSLEAEIALGADVRADSVDLAGLINDVEEAELTRLEPIEIQMTDSEKTQCSDEWRTCRERNASLAKHRGQTHSLILGQCSQLLKDKMKQDTEWHLVSCSCDPFIPHRLTEKTVSTHT